MTKNPPHPQRGDIVVQGLAAALMDDWKGKVLLREVVIDSTRGRVLDPPAGFFSNGWGPLPWRWSREELTRIQVWRIQ